MTHKETSFPHVLIQYVCLGLIFGWLNSNMTHKETYFPHVLIQYVCSGLIFTDLLINQG